jgi:hypothetical protein
MTGIAAYAFWGRANIFGDFFNIWPLKRVGSMACEPVGPVWHSGPRLAPPG